MPNTPQTWPGRAPVPRPSLPTRVSRSYALVVDGEEIRLDPGVVTLGRSPSCEVMLEDPLVSRQHARLLISNIGVLVEDLGSTNGVYVNELRIDAPTALGDGDRLLIGGIELVVRAGHRISRAVARAEPVRAKPPSDPAPATSPTERNDAFDTVGRLAERMLSVGRIESAVKLVSGHMKTILAAARAGQKIPARMIDAATEHALRLAAATHDVDYVDLALELNLLAKQPMRDDAIDELERLIGVLPRFDVALLLYYQQALHTELARLTPAERARADRILALRAEI